MTSPILSLRAAIRGLCLADTPLAFGAADIVRLRAAGLDDAEIVERTAVRSCVRRGAAIDLVLERGRENRSQFVLTHVKGREAIFWQTARTAKQARPQGRPPTARAGGRESLDIVVDSHERYAWKFSTLPVTLSKAALAAGDSLKDPAAYVRRLNKLLVELSV